MGVVMIRNFSTQSTAIQIQPNQSLVTGIVWLDQSDPFIKDVRSVNSSI